LTSGFAFLQANEGDAFGRRHGCERCEGGRAFAVVKGCWATAPDEADAERRRGDAGGRGRSDRRAQAIAPLRHQCRIGKQIWNLGGNVFQRGLKEQRQTEQWTMNVKWREGLPIGNPLIDAQMRLTFQEAMDLCLTKNDNASASRLYQRSVPNEVERIAQTLLGVQ